MLSLVKKSIRRARRARGFPEGSIHFLHVGKAAGSQISTIIKDINAHRAGAGIVKHGHEVQLKDLPAGQDYFFSVRDPITRYRSSFYSRKRKGQPRNYVEWSAQEAMAFANFEHANDLAEALFAEGARGREATAAMRSIRHCSRNLVDWFRFNGHMFEARPPIWIIRQEQFDADLQIFLDRIGYGKEVPVATDKTGTHANSYEKTPPLSDKAQSNLRAWYAQDYAFLDLCEHWMAANSPSD